MVGACCCILPNAAPQPVELRALCQLWPALGSLVVKFCQLTLTSTMNKWHWMSKNSGSMQPYATVFWSIVICLVPSKDDKAALMHTASGCISLSYAIKETHDGCTVSTRSCEFSSLYIMTARLSLYSSTMSVMPSTIQHARTIERRKSWTNIGGLAGVKHQRPIDLQLLHPVDDLDCPFPTLQPSTPGLTRSAHTNTATAPKDERRPAQKALTYSSRARA